MSSRPAPSDRGPMDPAGVEEHLQAREDVARLGAAAPIAPLLRGVMHQYSVTLVVALGVVLIVLAPSGRARIAAVVYAAGLVSCLGMSALYHRGRWSPRVKARLCTADHCTIFLLIAGTATPVALIAVGGWQGGAIIVSEWTGALCGIAIALLWRRPPVWIEVGPYLVLGWIGLLMLPALFARSGYAGVSLFLAGGALYTVGSICYSLERPDPWPRVFGFHEVFHAFVVAAVGTHAVAITLLTLGA